MLSQLLQRKADRTLGEFIRYAFFGSFAFIVDFGTLVLLTEYAGVHYLTAAAIGFVAGLTAIYFLSVSLIFRWRTYDDRALEFGFFAVCGIVGLGLNQALMYLLTDAAALHYIAAKVITAAIVLIWNFGSRKFLLFRQTDAAERS
jgi:putative flippase GtrA